MTKISFVVLSWNDSQIIENLLNSLKAEMVTVIDDFGSDEIRGLCQQYGSGYRLTPGNKGAPYSANLGMDLAQTELVCILHSDVSVLPTFSEKLIEAYIPGSILGISGYVIDRKLKLLSASKSCLPVDFVSGYCMIFERDKINRMNIRFDDRYRIQYWDADFCTLSSSKGIPVYTTDRIPLVHKPDGYGASAKLEDFNNIVRSDRHLFTDKWKKVYRRR